MWADSGNISVLKLVPFAGGIGEGREENWGSEVCAAGLVTGGVFTKKGKIPFNLGTWRPPSEHGREEKAAGLSHCCSSGSADSLIPTEPVRPSSQ